MHDNSNKVVVIILQPFKAVIRLFRNYLDIKNSTVDLLATFMFLCNMMSVLICYYLYKCVMHLVEKYCI